MNVIISNRPDQTALISVKVAAADYTDAAEKALREYKRKANVPGFRPGMVPMGIINKMYRKSVVAEEAYRAASKACFEYLETQGIDFMGDVLPSDEQQPIDFESGADLEFLFEIGIAPKVEIALGDKDKVERYKIEVTKQMRDGYRANFLRRFGQLVDTDIVTSDEAISVTLDNGQMQVQDAYVGLISMPEEERAPFIGKKVGDKMQVNVNELYRTPSQRAAVLQVKEHELAGIDPVFELTVTLIRRFAEPEVNAEFFKMAFPNGEVNDAKGFDKFIDSQIDAELSVHSNELFARTLRSYVIEKAALQLPEAFLKRWLFSVNEAKFTMEQIDADFPQFLEMMKWNLIQRHYITSLNLAVTAEELQAEAEREAAARFAQYGMASAGADMIADYARSMVADKKQAREMEEKALERKVLDSLATVVKISEKTISSEEFGHKVEQVRR